MAHALSGAISWSVSLWIVLALCGPGPRTVHGSAGPSAPRPASGDPVGRGRIAILKDDLPVGGDGLAEGTASSPEHLAGVLRGAGFGVTLIDCRRLADAGTLNRTHFDLLILPYGPGFPVAAADNLRGFLREGGKFISIGGYAFDNLLTRTNGGWRAYKPDPPTGSRDVRWRFDIPAGELRPHGVLTFSGWMQTSRVVGKQFAFMAVYQYDEAGKILTDAGYGNPYGIEYEGKTDDHEGVLKSKALLQRYA